MGYHEKLEDSGAQDDRIFTYYYERRAIEDDRHAEIEGEHKGDIERDERGIGDD